MASAKPRPAPTPSQPLFQHLFTFSLTPSLAQDMTVPEDTCGFFFVHEPCCSRGPSIWQWDYLACRNSEERPRRARSPVRTAPIRPVLECGTADMSVLACTRNVVSRTLVTEVAS